MGGGAQDGEPFHPFGVVGGEVQTDRAAERDPGVREALGAERVGEAEDERGQVRDGRR